MIASAEKEIIIAIVLVFISNLVMISEINI